MTGIRSNDTVYGNLGPLSVDATGAGVVVGANAGPTTVTLSGGGGLVYGGAGALNVLATGSGSDTIGLGSGAANITAGGSTSLAVFADGGPLTFVGGAGSSTVFAGTGVRRYSVVPAANSPTVENRAAPSAWFIVPARAAKRSMQVFPARTIVFLAGPWLAVPCLWLAAPGRTRWPLGRARTR